MRSQVQAGTDLQGVDEAKPLVFIMAATLLEMLLIRERLVD
jgi:hypothetical protein